MSMMPEEHIWIVIRPRGGLNLEKVGSTVGKAMVDATGLTTEQIEGDVICLNFKQTFLVASAPERSNAECYVKIRSVRVAHKNFEVSSYESAPNSTCKGVIPTVDIMYGPAALERNILNNSNLLALAVKRIKYTDSHKQVDVRYVCVGSLDSERMSVLCPISLIVEDVVLGILQRTMTVSLVASFVEVDI
ncbi:hypothetical protein HPB51_022925 [Rhipicephalus microplus]|uniref:Uncharacterized protein n=1 Tax=Rhipicephalus microplus TaxID=6941 RepID=A0A9J6D6X3_RHIMP|nr:hypothetical protein HPB51_022925 [Rhipicephalus microplus]